MLVSVYVRKMFGDVCVWKKKELSHECVPMARSAQAMASNIPPRMNCNGRVVRAWRLES